MLKFEVVTNATECVIISLVDDTFLENDEEFLIESANNSLVTIITSPVLITVEDDDRKTELTSS